MAVAVRVALVEAGFGPLPFVRRDASVAIEVETVEEIAGRLFFADDLRASQHAIAVAIQPLERFPAASATHAL